MLRKLAMLLLCEADRLILSAILFFLSRKIEEKHILRFSLALNLLYHQYDFTKILQKSDKTFKRPILIYETNLCFMIHTLPIDDKVHGRMEAMGLMFVCAQIMAYHSKSSLTKMVLDKS